MVVTRARSATETSPTNDLLEGRYEVGALIGRGGMAEVHSGRDLRLNRAVAIKLLPHSPSADRERFGAEAHVLAQLSHPNLVRVFDAGGDDNVAWLIMELVKGETMADLCRRGPLTDRQVTEAGRQLGDALAYVHREGVVHRDVKPSNILFDEQGRCMLADFGVARLVDQVSLTATGMALGTPAYLAPEQAAGEQVGPPADIYSLGLVLAEALTGHRVFNGSAVEMAAARVVRDAELPGGLSPEWRLLLRNMTRRDPAARPTAAELTELLDERLGMTRPMPVAPGADMATGKMADTSAFSGTEVLPGAAASTVPEQVAVQPARTEPALRSMTATRPLRNRRALVRTVLLCALALAVGFAVAAALGFGLSPAAARHSPPTTTLKGKAAVHKPTPSSTPSTTAATTTTTTTVSSLSVATGSFAAAVETSLQKHELSPSTAQALDAQVTQLTTQYAQLSPAQLAQQLQQVAQAIGNEVKQGQLTGAAVPSVEGSLRQLARALGDTTVLTFSTPSPGPGGVGGGPGHGHGNGHGNGNSPGG